MPPAEPRRGATLYVLAGTNGAGKSSLGGAVFRQTGADYFNPDDATREILAANPGLELARANSLAWHQGRRLLEESIHLGKHYAFETTLGGRTIPRMLHEALDRGAEVRVLYVGLESAELHIARVRARVKGGGHDIPETRIRERYDRSRRNLIDLIPRLTELRLFDNSIEADPAVGPAPEPLLILHMQGGRIVTMCRLDAVPTWAKPIVASALRFR